MLHTLESFSPLKYLEVFQGLWVKYSSLHLSLSNLHFCYTFWHVPFPFISFPLSFIVFYVIDGTTSLHWQQSYKLFLVKILINIINIYAERDVLFKHVYKMYDRNQKLYYIHTREENRTIPLVKLSKYVL